MRKSKVLCLIASLVLLVALLAGCGANVSTVMDINTANGGFAGNRVITLLIKNDDLSSVTGGLNGLETVLTENLPADLTYAITFPSETQTQIDFTLSFASMAEYKDKTTNLLALDAENVIVPEIVFEKSDNLFRRGMKYTENFQSFDLLRWYFNALQVADIINEATSDWYDLGEDKLIMDGVELETYGHRFDYDKIEERLLDGCDVVTFMNINGTFDRTITFKADKHTLEDLAEVTDDFAGYMKGLTPEGVTYTTETDEDSDYTTYTYTMAGLTAEELVAKTNAIMQSEDNAFSVTIAPKEGVAGTAVVTIEESLDASYYMDRAVRSTIVTYPSFKLTEGDAYMNYGTSEISYSAGSGEDYKLVGDWLVGYEKVELALKASGADKLSATFTFKTSDALAEEIRNIAFAALQSACADRAEFSKDGATATCTFSGTAMEVASKLDAFVKVYAPAEEDYETSYADTELREMNTASKFTNGVFGALSINLQPVLGDAKIYVSGDGATEIVSGLNSDENGAYTDSNFTIRFCAERLNIVTLILTIFFGLLILAGGAWGFINRAGFMEWLAFIKEKTKKAPAVEAPAAEEEIAEPIEAPIEAPAEEPAEAPVAETPAAAEEEEEEEIL